MPTGIEWADEVWNPVTGCDPVSSGCDNCYAKRRAKRMAGQFGYYKENPFRVTIHEDRFLQPFKWKKPKRIFVGSMGDVFHDYVEDDIIAKIFMVVALNPRHTFIFLTKRPIRLKYFSTHDWFQELYRKTLRTNAALSGLPEPAPWPLKNAWFGVSIENQATATERLGILFETPVSHRFVSCEPLLGPIDFRKIPGWPQNTKEAFKQEFRWWIEWVICGGETGPSARPLGREWVEDIMSDCQFASTPFFFKKWGIIQPGHSIFGKEYRQWPKGMKI